jgi:uncharacterized protein (TIGR00251 family)
MESFFRLQDGVLLLDIKAQPGASRSRVAGVTGGRLKVQIASAAEDGKANAELTVLLSKLLGCAKKEIAIKAGEKSRLKTVTLPAACREKLEKLFKESEE